MIRSLDSKPEGFPDAQGCNWVELHDGSSVYAVAAYMFVGDQCVLHIYPKEFNRRVIRHMRDDLEEFEAALKKLGVKQIIGVTADATDRRWPKFVRLFEFGPAVQMAVKEL